MSRYGARIRQLEAKLRPEPERPLVVVLWVMYDGEVPDWAEAALRPHLPTTGAVIVTWHQAPSTGELGAEVNGRWYIVTPDGCEPTEPPITFNLFDKPDEAGLGPITLSASP